MSIENKPIGVTITLNGSYVYLSNCGDIPGTVSAIKTDTNMASNPNIAVGLTPMGIATSQYGQNVYVANSGDTPDGTVSVLNSTNAVTNIDTGAKPLSSDGVAASSYGSTYVVYNDESFNNL